MKSLQTY